MAMAADAVGAGKARTVFAPTASVRGPKGRAARKRAGEHGPTFAHRRHAAVGGFSLLEMVLVLVILAIAAAIAVPRHAAAVARYRTEAAARRIAADLVQARSLARQTSRDQTVVFDTAADCYTLVGFDDPDRPGRPYTVALAEAPYHANLTGVAFGEEASVTFDGFGAADQSGKVAVQVGGYRWTVTVDGESGEVATSGPSGG